MVEGLSSQETWWERRNQAWSPELHWPREDLCSVSGTAGAVLPKGRALGCEAAPGHGHGHG